MFGNTGACNLTTNTRTNGTINFKEGSLKLECLVDNNDPTYLDVKIDPITNKLFKATASGGGGNPDPQTHTNTLDIASNLVKINNNTAQITINTGSILSNTSDIGGKVSKTATNIISAQNTFTAADDLNVFSNRILCGTSVTDGVVIKKDQIAMIDGQNTLASITPSAVNLNTDIFLGESGDDGKTCTIRAGGASAGGNQLDGLIIASDTKITGTCKLEGAAFLHGVVTHDQGQVPTSFLATNATSQAITASVTTADAQNPMADFMGFNSAGAIVKTAATFSGNVVGTSAIPQPNEIYWSGKQHMTLDSSSAFSLEVGDPQTANNNYIFNCNGRGAFGGELAVEALDIHITTGQNPIIFHQQLPGQSPTGAAWPLILESYTIAGGATQYRMARNATGDQTFTGTVQAGAVIIDEGTAPTSSSDTGTQGEVRWAEVAGGGGGASSYYMYVCVATNTWRRQVLDDWQ